MSMIRNVIARHLQASSMPEPEFWRIIDEIGWGSRTQNYKAVRRQLVRKLTRDQAKAMQATFWRLDEALRKALDPIAEATGLGDDGFDDLRSHVIGLGKREYEATLRDPNRALERARKGGFQESFTYCLPHDVDYDELNFGAISRRAKSVYETYHDLSQIRQDVRELRPVLGDLNLITTAVGEFLKSNDASALLAQDRELRRAATSVAEALGQTRFAGLPYAVGDVVEAGRRPARVAELLEDVRDFLS